MAEFFTEPPLRLCDESEELFYDEAKLWSFIESFLMFSGLASLLVGLWTQTMERYVLPYVGERLLSARNWENEHKRNRFVHHAVLFFHHTFGFLMGVQIVATFYDCWKAEHYRCNSQCAPKDILMWFSGVIDGQQMIAFIYAYQMGHYLYGFIDLLFLKPRKRDFKTMVVHHAVTVLLIGISVLTCLQKAGIGILVFFDVADIFIMIINISKCTDNNGVIVKLSYILLVLTFGVPRLLLLPYLLPHHILYGGPHLPYEEWLWAALAVLTLCNLRWFLMILRVGWGALNGKAIDDTRGNYEKKSHNS